MLSSGPSLFSASTSAPCGCFTAGGRQGTERPLGAHRPPSVHWGPGRGVGHREEEEEGGAWRQINTSFGSATTAVACLTDGRSVYQTEGHFLLAAGSGRRITMRPISIHHVPGRVPLALAVKASRNRKVTVGGADQLPSERPSEEPPGEVVYRSTERTAPPSGLQVH